MKTEYPDRLEVNFMGMSNFYALNVGDDRSRLFCVPQKIIAEHWVSGNGRLWYILLDDNFVIQGGVTTASTSSSQTSVTLTKPFANNYYSALATHHLGSTANNYNPAIISKTTTSFTWNSNLNNYSTSATFSWVAFGTARAT
jgi:hypothetical protein